MYREVLNVPLVLSLPGRIPANQVVDAPAGLRNLPKTILDVIGRPTVPFLGTSLRAYWEDGVSATDYAPVLASEVDLRGNRSNALIADSLYFVDWQGAIELYRFPDDTVQANDLAGTAAYRSRIAEFRSISDSLNAIAEALLPGRRPGGG
jgi:hypothetical protein